MTKYSIKCTLKHPGNHFTLQNGATVFVDNTTKNIHFYVDDLEKWLKKINPEEFSKIKIVIYEGSPDLTSI